MNHEITIDPAPSRVIGGTATSKSSSAEDQDRSLFVRLTSDHQHQFAPGCKYHIDEHGRLHIVRPSGGNVASFAALEWSGVWYDGAF